jgi:hypothetical protein
MKTGRREIVRAAVQLALLGALAIPAVAETREVLGYAGVLGEWELTANVTGDDSTKPLDGRQPGGKEGRNPAADFTTGVADIGNVIARRRRVHIQRPAVGFLFGNHELPGAGAHTAEDLAQIANQ